MAKAVKYKKKKFEIEYLLKTLPGILYPRLATSTGLSEWFADKVDQDNNLFHFDWSGYQDQATLVSKKTEEHIRFQWIEDKGTDYYFEFKIKIDPMTGELILAVVDFCDENDTKESISLWNHQISDLKHNLGLV